MMVARFEGGELPTVTPQIGTPTEAGAPMEIPPMMGAPMEMPPMMGAPMDIGAPMGMPPMMGMEVGMVGKEATMVVGADEVTPGNLL